MSRGWGPDDQAAACKNILNYATEQTGKVDQMDARVFDWEVSEESSPFKDMFKYSDQVDELKEALHITKPDRFSSLNSTVASELTDRENDAASVYTEILSY